MSQYTGRRNVEVMGRSGKSIPQVYAVQAAPNRPPYGVPPWSVSAVFTNTADIVIPAGPAGQSGVITAAVQVGSFPSPIVLKPTDQGQVGVSVFLNISPQQVMIGLPFVSIGFGSGGGTNGASGTGSLFTLQAGRSYSAPVVFLNLPYLLLGPLINAQTLTVSVQAVLYGLVAQGQ